MKVSNSEVVVLLCITSMIEIERNPRIATTAKDAQTNRKKMKNRIVFEHVGEGVGR